ncbi:hypothetical protein BDA99DRAFT_539724 [Phascolomyces articulosus]|uniref:Uncharacterized protein n=1 Tax=Phascolomyces articulosus TaxID=60185 RepID=A0AAD5JVT5_9FUNG|nr:hypothetical protein BDA99DRAFT_539724 [Phascolomyces articulosus]
MIESRFINRTPQYVYVGIILSLNCKFGTQQCKTKHRSRQCIYKNILFHKLFYAYENVLVIISLIYKKKPLGRLQNTRKCSSINVLCNYILEYGRKYKNEKIIPFFMPSKNHSAPNSVDEITFSKNKKHIEKHNLQLHKRTISSLTHCGNSNNIYYFTHHVDQI